MQGLGSVLEFEKLPRDAPKGLDLSTACVGLSHRCSMRSAGWELRC